jgi:diguanylate cyclase (GGDEF)-like protein
MRAILDQLVRPELFLARFEEVKANTEADTVDVLEFKDGRVYERRSRPQRVDGRVVGRVWSFGDVTDKNRLMNELTHQAFHDSLTGLSNRALLRDRLEHALARSRRSGATVSVLFCDLDGFKMINDTMGHDAGDMLLVEVARRFQATIREGDTVARLGGDEFAIVVDETSGNGATALARRLLDILSDPFLINGREVFARASIGVADNHADALDADELLCRADIAMYAAKANGRDRFEVFESTMQVDLTTRHELYGDLRHALAVGQFTLYYQPLIDLETNQVESIEALLRWRHPKRGIVGADEIIPICEETGLIIEIGGWVLREACRQLAEWTATIGAHTRMSVNVSALQLYHETFIADVAAALADARLDPHRLVLELTESTLLSNTGLVYERLEALKSLGVHVAIDDFGTGYSSLSYLHLFPVDVLKIDRSFVQSLHPHSEGRNEKLVRSIVGMAQHLGLGVVAEGIEQEEQLAALREAGCATGQGFLFARPLPADQVPLTIERLSRAPAADGRPAKDTKAAP